MCLSPFRELYSALWKGNWSFGSRSLFCFGHLWGIIGTAQVLIREQRVPGFLKTVFITSVSSEKNHPSAHPMCLWANSRKVLCRGKENQASEHKSPLTLDPHNEQTQVLASCQHSQILQSGLFGQAFCLLSFQQGWGVWGWICDYALSFH